MTLYRILEVVSGLGMGGAEKALLNRMNYLPNGFNQSILNVRPEIDVLTLDPNIQQYKIESRGLIRFINIKKFLKAQHFDLIVVRTPLDAIRFALIKYLNYRNPFLLIFEAHSNFVSKKIIFNLLMKILLRISFRNIDSVIAISESVSKGPLCQGHREIQIIHLGGQLNLSQHKLSPVPTPRLLFVGRLVALKRPIWLLERLKVLDLKMKLPPFALTIVGNGPLESEVKDFIRDNKMERIVNFVGLQLDVAPFFESATHLVSCSTNEGLPLTFFEAKLAGLQIVSTPSGGGAEIFGDEDLELSSFDESEFERVLVKIFTGPPTTLEMRKRIQLRSQWMSAKQGAKRYYELLINLLDT